MAKTDTESFSASNVSTRDLTELRIELEGKISTYKTDLDKKVSDQTFTLVIGGIVVIGMAAIGVLYYQNWDMNTRLGDYKTRITVLEKQLQETIIKKTP
jgi:hypothetical protein